MFAPSLNPSPQGGGKCWKTLTFFQKPAFQSFSKFLEYLIKATASILKSSIDANLCLPLFWICSTLLSSLVPFAIRTYFVSSVRKSALPHRGQSDGARDKVCHPELVSGSELSAKHTSPYPLLLRRGYSSLSKSRLVESFYKFLNI